MTDVNTIASRYIEAVERTHAEPPARDPQPAMNQDAKYVDPLIRRRP